MLTYSEMNRTILDLVDGLSSADMFAFIMYLSNQPNGMKEVNRFNLLRWMYITGKEINSDVSWRDTEVFRGAFL